ncbi:MAG: type II secretion system protein [Verrucomicrobiaceae bacterium]|nr:MAG: type II secretion system protein [Verrucomicrobiaceae bacterium]
MIFQKPTRTSGFTLVELLVVIVIIGSLAALSFTVGPKMMAKARATESMQNIRQIGPVIMNYASDNAMQLPAILAQAVQEDGTTPMVQWHEECLETLYPNDKLSDFRTADWWNKNKPFMRNPMFKQGATPRGWTPQNPGYAFNEMIVENLALATGAALPSHDVLLARRVPMASITEPNRTPLIAPYDNYYYRFDEAETGAFLKSNNFKKLSVEGKIPVLFIDGHLESLKPEEYVERRLHRIPSPESDQ